jgi:hypothetical protein
MTFAWSGRFRRGVSGPEGLARCGGQGADPGTQALARNGADGESISTLANDFALNRD